MSVGGYTIAEASAVLVNVRVGITLRHSIAIVRACSGIVLTATTARGVWWRTVRRLAESAVIARATKSRDKVCVKNHKNYQQ